MFEVVCEPEDEMFCGWVVIYKDNEPFCRISYSEDDEATKQRAIARAELIVRGLRSIGPPPKAPPRSPEPPLEALRPIRLGDL